MTTFSAQTTCYTASSDTITITSGGTSTASDTITINGSGYYTYGTGVTSVGSYTINTSAIPSLTTSQINAINTACIPNINTSSFKIHFPEEFVNAFPDWERVEKMCKEYPGFKIAFEKFKTTYYLIKDHYDTPEDQRPRP